MSFISLDFKLFGNWSRVRNFINSLDAELIFASTRGQRSAAEKFARLVKKHLRDQDLKGQWSDLNKEYALKKAKKGLDAGQILIATEDYYKAIGTWRINGVYHAGVKKTAVYGNGISISRVASIHEAWSTEPGRPYRPLWSYTFQNDMGGEKGIRSLVLESMHEYMIRNGIPWQKLKF